MRTSREGSFLIFGIAGSVGVAMALASGCSGNGTAPQSSGPDSPGTGVHPASGAAGQDTASVQQAYGLLAGDITQCADDAQSCRGKAGADVSRAGACGTALRA